MPTEEKVRPTGLVYEALPDGRIVANMSVRAIAPPQG